MGSGRKHRSIAHDAKIIPDCLTRIIYSLKTVKGRGISSAFIHFRGKIR